VNVTFCLTSFLLGGTELNAVRTAERLKASGINIRAVTLSLRGPLLERWRDAGIPITEYAMPSLASIRGVRQCLGLARQLASERTHVLHAHSVWANVLGVPAARLARVPCVVASRRWGVRDLGRGLGAANQAAYRMADCVLANSSAVAALVHDDDGIATPRIAVVPNFVDDEGFTPPEISWERAFRASIQVPDTERLIVAVGRLTADKDHATLIRAFAVAARTRPGWTLVLVGDGELREDVEALITSLDLSSRVRLAGSRPHRPSPYFAASLAAHSSVSEGFPNAIVEAMAAGRATVSTTAGGCVDAVRPGHTGLLVPVASVPAYAEALGQLMDDDGLRAQMGAAALRVAREDYAADAVVRRLLALYSDVLDRRSGWASPVVAPPPPPVHS